MAALTFVLPEDVEDGDLVNLSSVPLLATNVVSVPDEAVTLTGEAEDVDKFNVKLWAGDAFFIVSRATNLPYDGNVYDDDDCC